MLRGLHARLRVKLTSRSGLVEAMLTENAFIISSGRRSAGSFIDVCVVAVVIVKVLAILVGVVGFRSCSSNSSSGSIRPPSLPGTWACAVTSVFPVTCKL